MIKETTSVLYLSDADLVDHRNTHFITLENIDKYALTSKAYEEYKIAGVVIYDGKLGTRVIKGRHLKNI